MRVAFVIFTLLPLIAVNLAESSVQLEFCMSRCVADARSRRTCMKSSDQPIGNVPRPHDDSEKPEYDTTEKLKFVPYAMKGKLRSMDDDDDSGRPRRPDIPDAVKEWLLFGRPSKSGNKSTISGRGDMPTEAQQWIEEKLKSSRNYRPPTGENQVSFSEFLRYWANAANPDKPLSPYSNKKLK